jgi:hypothetical protein
MLAQQVSTRESCGVGDRFDRKTGAFLEFLRAGEPGRDEPGDGRLPGLGRVPGGVTSGRLGDSGASDADTLIR